MYFTSDEFSSSYDGHGSILNFQHFIHPNFWSLDLLEAILGIALSSVHLNFTVFRHVLGNFIMYFIMF